jgi:signal transduction histidine kinase/ligand-binding sensor domain-containing protein
MNILARVTDESGPPPLVGREHSQLAAEPGPPASAIRHDLCFGFANPLDRKGMRTQAIGVMIRLQFSALVGCRKSKMAAMLALIYSVLAASLNAESSEVKDLRSEFIVDFWQTDQGLPDNFITSLAQTPDGYIWVATFSGLARFNGTDFVSFDAANTPELPESRIVNLYLDRAGRLWIGSENGQISSWKDGQFHLYTEKDGLPHRNWPTIRFNLEGNLVWAASPIDTEFRQFNGKVFEVARSDTAVFTRLPYAYDPEFGGWAIDGTNLVSTNPKRNGPWPVPDCEGRAGWRVEYSPDGSVWVVTTSHIHKFKGGEWRDMGALPFQTDLFEGQKADHLGNLWLGVSVGEIWRIDPSGKRTRFKLGDKNITELARVIIEDAENNLWIGTGGGGLMRLKPRALKSYDSRQGLTSDVVRSVTEASDGTIWMATVNSVDCFRAGNFEKAEKHHPMIELPWRVLGARDGSLWVGSYGEGLFRFGADRAELFRTVLKENPPNLALLETSAGQLYVGSVRGLFLVGEDGLIRMEPAPAIGVMDVRALAEGSGGEIYAGLNGLGLLRKSGEKWDRFTTRDGLADDHVFGLHRDSTGVVWIGTHGKGLSRLKDGKMFNFANTSIAVPRVVFGILEDDFGYLWLASNQGIYRAALKELNAVADGQSNAALVVQYNQSEGMGSSACTGSQCKAHDGTLWFATMNGVTAVNPRSLPINTRPPPVVIEQILLDDKVASTRSDTSFTIPPGLHRLEIRFAGLSFTAPQRVQYRYKLNGYDHDWVDAGNRRVAYYTGIDPGEYRFQVRAANNDGVWNDAGATLQLIAQPYFWQRRSFQFAVLIILLGTAAGVARYWAVFRFRQRVSELERRHALDKERGRISRDLHDSLGADLSQLALWSDLALQAKDNPAMAERVEDVSKLTREVIQNVEEIVWTVNPKNDSVDNFAAYLCEFSERVVTRAGLRFRWEAPDFIPPIPLASDTRHHVFLATKEALNNIVKHAGASEVRISLNIREDSIAIVIADDGKGFDVQTAISNGGNGLGNMRERISACGGTVTIESAPGPGTTICAKIPLVKATDKWLTHSCDVQKA